SMWSGTTFNLLDGDEGLIDAMQFDAAIRPHNIHHPRPRLLSLENTTMRGAGAAIHPDRMQPVIDVARRHGLAVHLDGARLFNAAIALNVPVTDLTNPVDTVSICLSKGLGAPIGSLLVGPRDFIERATTYRKWLGGGLRQDGMLGAAGIIALTHHVDRLREDHDRARQLAEDLRRIGYQIYQPAVPTNMLMVDVPGSAEAFVEALAHEGVMTGALGPHRIRLVTHLDVNDDHVAYALKVFDHLAEQYA
ncbi:MAG: beta-eliminating lyase-related protein, partial [Firmicutes bacterium]|nr:beta-eliminating lyase-related protein [Bacillota bacterium]